jgi:squalene synthase HpnD
MSQGIAARPADAPAMAPKRPSGSSFYLAMKLLPADRRDAMYEIYGFCRAVDDIADGDSPHPQRQSDLQAWRRDIEDIYRGTTPARLAGLAAAVGRFDLQREDFLAVIDGMEMDAQRDIRAPDMASLDLYCDRVASAVGRLSVRIFGMEAAAGRELAHHLGRALQLTNILRDLDEDAGLGRLYLPAEALREAGIDSSDPAVVLAHPNLGQACKVVAKRAQNHFREADRIMAAAPRRATRAPRLMEAVYRRILDRMTVRGWAPPRPRVRIGRPLLLWIVLRDGLF